MHEMPLLEEADDYFQMEARMEARRHTYHPGGAIGPRH